MTGLISNETSYKMVRTKRATYLTSNDDDKGGFDYQFVDTPPETVVCKICYCPSRTPHLSVCCGHVFCESCLEGAEEVTAVSKVCPMCRSEEFSHFPNKQADRIVRGLHVYCINRGKGCTWLGEINNIDEHLKDSEGCRFVEVNCYNYCGKLLQRRHLSNHVENDCRYRKVNCRFCSITGEYHFIEGPHKQICIRRPLPCPNKCDLPTTASDVSEHLKICPLEFTECEYHTVGCTTRIIRNEQKKHNMETMEEHLSLTMKQLLYTKSELVSTKSELVSAKTELKRQIGETSQDLVETREQHSKTVTTMIKNQLQQEETFQKKIDSVENTAKESIKWLESQLTATAEKVYATMRRLELLNTSAREQLSGELVAPVIIKMSGYSEYKESGSNWYSESFYTHQVGYKMQLCVNVNGWFSRIHIALEIYIVKGPFDNFIPWPLVGKMELKLLNQISDNEHHSVIVDFRGLNSRLTICRVPAHSTETRSTSAACWDNEFISHEQFYQITPTRRFLKDDCIFFQVCRLNYC